MQRRQSEEFAIRGRVLPAQDIIRSATSVGAKLMRMEGEIGAIVPGARADIVAVDGDPLADIAILSDPERRMPLIVREGRVVRNRL
jgi:imidazolonepropionase-like amidohydrolase